MSSKLLGPTAAKTLLPHRRRPIAGWLNGRRTDRIAALGRRLGQYRQQHGVPALLRRVAEILVERALRPVALLLYYYPQVLSDIVRWQRRTHPTVLGVIAGERPIQGGRYAVFVMWQPERTPWFVLNALRALAEVGANVLLVVNHPLCDERLAELTPLCARIMIRDNTGLDFGAYKDAVAHLAGDELERLLLLNDSIYYFAPGLPVLFGRLVGSSADLCASHENVQSKPHLQSFCLSLSGRMVRSPAFRRFWQAYIPVRSRRWAIHQGEMALSAALRPVATDTEVLYRAEDLASLLPEAARITPNEAIGYLPVPLRRRLGPQPEISAEGLAALAAGGSQIHTAGFLFRELRGAPLLKRDLVFRHQFTAQECRALLAATGDEGHLEAIMADLSRKGLPPRHGTLRHAKWATGLI